MRRKTFHDCSRRLSSTPICDHRRRRRDPRRAAFWRYTANCVADFWISWAAGAPFADSQSGFRVYPASLLSRVKITHGKVRSFVFESEILIEATRAGHPSLAVPIEALYRPGARPSYFLPVRDVARITGMVAWKLISRGMYPSGLYRSLFAQAPPPRKGVKALRMGRPGTGTHDQRTQPSAIII